LFKFSFIGHEQGVAIVEEYDRKSLYHLHPLVKSKLGIVNKRMDEDYSLDIFEMIASTSDSTKELINKKLVIFKLTQVDVKDMKCLFQWWEKLETMFPIVGFFVLQILLGIVG
jgi:hypothetical protein